MMLLGNTTNLAILSLLLSVIVMTILWWRQYRTQNATIVDVGWASCICVSVIVGAIVAGNGSANTLLGVIMGGGWSGRLAWHLYRDRVRGKGEDGRYRALREHWGSSANVRFLFFFQAQALMAALFSLPALFIVSHSTPWGVLTLVGIGVWTISVGGEAIADSQLARFRDNQENRGRTCRQGLWRYSRHPNYFFEWLHWWSYVFVLWGHPQWGIVLALPFLMLFFLFKLTGIPYTELQAVKSRGDDYREYQRTTSMFIPWFPRT